MLLSVNIDHIATLRQARLSNEPDPVMAATLAIMGGADGITLHLREDRRHVNDRDLRLLREIVTCELNLEMAATDEMVDIAIKTLPDLVTIVPEKRAEITTEGGINFEGVKGNLKEKVRKLQDKGIKVSVFINPNTADIHTAKELSFDMVEIHTGFYSNAKADLKDREFETIQNAVNTAKSISMVTNAGHGLNYFNVSRIATIKDIRGLYIGHSIVSRAVLVGMERAVRDMNALIKGR
ncbi:MAG: pyridoxine 5'-phosphate synthase [Thermodesulfovibrionales bacterium]